MSKAFGKYIILVLLLGLPPCLFCQKKDAVVFYTIPSQTLNLFQLIIPPEDYSDFLKRDTINHKANYTNQSFQISKQVTLKEYKTYLKAIKKDSSEQFYISQLPHIKGVSEKKMHIYLNDKKFEGSPVVGISWESVMHYCKWKTISENGNNISFIYRIPSSFEWLIAFYYLENKKIKHDFNLNYSDWLLNPAMYCCLKGWNYDNIYMYLREKDKYPNKYMDNKLIIGKSYLSTIFKTFHESFHFAFEGYQYVGFRLLKENIKQSPQFDNIIGTLTPSTEEYTQGTTIAEHCLNYWKCR